MSRIDDPIFPVLTVATNGFLEPVMDRESLETCGRSALRSGYYDGLLLVDSRGRSWQVQHAEKVGDVGPLGGWRLMYSRHIRVRLDLTKRDPFGLDSLKDRVCEAIEDLPEQWEAVEEIEDTKARVRGATDIPALIRMFEFR